ncbi:MAG: sensor histidine kinase [Phycisphaerales bacterium]|nr:MAG: sensor histidine kinase [Phycisphaerales bacterium]
MAPRQSDLHPAREAVQRDSGAVPHHDSVAAVSEALQAAEERIAQLEDDLERASRLAALGTLAAGIAHEINNLLSPAYAYAQYASQRQNDPELTRKALGHTLRSVKQATSIADNMLGYASGSDDATYANIRDCFEQARACLVRDPASDGITFHVELAEDLSVAMRPRALQQVFFNLILNAVAAMKTSGGGRMTVAAEADDDGYALIRIRDTGPGIPEAIQDDLFTPFVAASKNRTDIRRSSGGSGLGLSVCRMLVAQANGTIELLETSDQGTTFQIYLPRAQSENVSNRRKDRCNKPRNAA